MKSALAMEFGILGPLEMSVRGQPTNVGGRTPRTLLAMLVLHLNRTVHPDILMAGLWGDDPPASATNSLHSHVSRLRRLVVESGEECRLERRTGGYALCGDPDLVDANRFERLVREGAPTSDAGSRGSSTPLREALALWRGPALLEFADAEFARAETVRLNELRLEATATVIDLELGLGAAGSLVPELEHLVAEQPLQERFWGQLMVALYREGRQAEALNAYRRVRRLLHTEIGVEPGQSLRTLEELVLQQSPKLDPPPAQEISIPTLSSQAGRTLLNVSSRQPVSESFVGRDDVMQRLGEALSHAGEGVGQLVVLEAPAGLGKTATIEQLLIHAAQRDVSACVGRAWEESGGPPYWPWVEALRGRCRQLGDSYDVTAVSLTDLLPGWTDNELRDPAQERFRLYQQVVRRVLPSEGGAPSLIVLEDVHGADDSSLQLLRFTLRALHRAACMVVLTHRPVGPDTVLARVLAEANREVEVTRLQLRPLDDAAVRIYLEHQLGENTAPEIVAAILERAEGHPFFLAEIVRMVRGSLVHTGSASGDSWLAEIPRTVGELIRRRFVPLSDETLRTLLTASVIGRSFDLRLLGQVTRLDNDALLDQVEQAAAIGLLHEPPGETLAYRFDHALTQQTLYELLSMPRRKMLHARTAEALAGGPFGATKTRLTELARHSCLAVPESDLSDAVEAAAGAAHEATLRLAFEEAARLNQLALDTHVRHGGDSADTGRLLVALGLSHQRAGQPEAARPSLLRAAHLARSQRDGDQLAAAALALSAAFEKHSHDAELVALLREALAGLPPDRGSSRAQLFARLSMALNLKDPGDERQHLSRLALTIAHDLDDPALKASCLSAHFLALWGLGMHDERANCAKEGLRLAEALDDRELILDALTWSICEAVEAADRPALDAYRKRHAQLAEAIRHPLHLYQACVWRAMIAAVDGRAAEAIAATEQAVALGEPITELAAPRRVAVMFAVLRDLGRSSELEPMVARVAELTPLIPTWRAIHALIMLESGNSEAALRIVRALPDDLHRFVPRDGNWLVGMGALVELTCGLRDVELAGRLFDVLEPFSGRIAATRFAVACLSPVDRFLGRLAAVCEDWGKAEAHFEVALRVSRSFGAGPFLAYSQADYAQMLRCRGGARDASTAASLLAEALRTANDLELPGLHAYCSAAMTSPPKLGNR